MTSQCVASEPVSTVETQRSLPDYAAAAKAIATMAETGELVVEIGGKNNPRLSTLSRLLAELHLEAHKVMIDALIKFGHARLPTENEINESAEPPKLIAL